MKTQIFFMDADYVVENGKPIVRLFGRTKDGNPAMALDDSLEPYFYAVPKKTAKIKSKLEKISFSDAGMKVSPARVEDAERIDGIEKVKMMKVVTRLPSHVPKLKEEARRLKEIANVREFDIPFARKYVYDKQVVPGGWIEVTGDEVDGPAGLKTIRATSVKSLNIEEVPKLKILSFDIELAAGRGNEVIMMSLVTNKGFKTVLTTKKASFKDAMHVSDEKMLLLEFVRILSSQKPDIITGYNTDRFDFSIIRDRALKHKISLDIGWAGKPLRFRAKGRDNAALVEGAVHLDMYQFVSTVTRTSLTSETLSLNNVAKELLGQQKRDLKWEEMTKLWEEGKPKGIGVIADYCLQDSVLAMKICEKLAPNIFALSQLTGGVPFEICRSRYGALVVSFAMLRAAKLGVVVPNKPPREEMQKRIAIGGVEGAFVVEPTPGLHKDVAIYDFRSLYPSIIISHNIDPSTLKCSCCKTSKNGHNKVPEFNIWFCEKKQGFVPSILGELLSTRAKVKKKMKAAGESSPEYKALYARQYAMKTVANTFYGYLGFAGSRWYAHQCAEAVTAFGRHYIHSVIKAAEDAGFPVIYGDTDSVFLKLEGKTKKAADAFLKEINSKLPGIMELEFEGKFERGLFVTRKQGGGAKKKYALIDKRGKLKIRGFAQVRRDWSRLAKETQEKVLQLILSDKKDAAVKHVRKVIETVKSGKIPLEKLAIHSQITRPLDAYRQIGPHVAAAMKAEKQGIVVEPGTIIAYVITKGKGRISDKAVVSSLATDYDPDYYINNQIIPTALDALDVLGVTEEDLLGIHKQSGLLKFSS